MCKNTNYLGTEIETIIVVRFLHQKNRPFDVKRTIPLMSHYEGHWEHVPHIDRLAIVAAWGEIVQGLHEASGLFVKVFVS